MKNWKTTLIGILTAIANTLLPALSTGAVSWKDIAISSGIAALGFLSKDAGVSGPGM